MPRRKSPIPKRQPGTHASPGEGSIYGPDARGYYRAAFTVAQLDGTTKRVYLSAASDEAIMAKVKAFRENKEAGRLTQPPMQTTTVWRTMQPTRIAKGKPGSFWQLPSGKWCGVASAIGPDGGLTGRWLFADSEAAAIQKVAEYEQSLIAALENGPTPEPEPELQFTLPARRTPARPSFSRTDLLTVWLRDNGICGICGESVEPAETSIDHVMPLARGGAHELSNWQLAHRRCNSGKRDRVPICAPETISQHT